MPNLRLLDITHNSIESYRYMPKSIKILYTCYVPANAIRSINKLYSILNANELYDKQLTQALRRWVQLIKLQRAIYHYLYDDLDVDGLSRICKLDCKQLNK